jgi:cyclopropane-fatty-acyl-phospholipid synthase
MSDVLTTLAERAVLPDGVIRLGMRRLLAAQLRRDGHGGAAEIEARKAALIARLSAGPIVEHATDANRQHYEMPAGFFELVLGPRLKYSACEWPPGADLAAAEEATLAQLAERAQLEDGQRVLDLGCGWGSAALWIAEHYPRSQVLGVSNSAGQRRFIEARAQARGLANVRIVTADAATFDTPERFDRIVSVEMLEHVRNHALLSQRLAGFLVPGGAMFVHVFAHKELLYLYETDDGEESWMARHFFTGGVMPSHDLLPRVFRGMALEQDWRTDGTGYARTLEAWLARLDAQRGVVTRALVQGGAAPDGGGIAVQRWRMFLMACAELFAFDHGREWGVSHYRFRKSE